MLAEQRNVAPLTITLPRTGCHSASICPSATKPWHRASMTSVTRHSDRKHEHIYPGHVYNILYMFCQVIPNNASEIDPTHRQALSITSEMEKLDIKCRHSFIFFVFWEGFKKQSLTTAESVHGNGEMSCVRLLNGCWYLPKLRKSWRWEIIMILIVVVEEDGGGCRLFVGNVTWRKDALQDNFDPSCFS
jgi:hypothetical protein